jgi:hypothetical protein
MWNVVWECQLNKVPHLTVRFFGIIHGRFNIKVAMLLSAVESTIKEQNEACTPLAYFGALVCVALDNLLHIKTALHHLLLYLHVLKHSIQMNLLEQQNSNSSNKDAEAIIVAAANLLAIVFPR